MSNFEFISVNPAGYRRLCNVTKALSHTVFACLVVILGLISPAIAQSPPLANPNLQLITNGKVNAIVRLADGSIVFGGLFNGVNGVPRSNIAKLQPDGSLDPTWSPGADGEVLALANDSSGNIYIGGAFNNVGGQARDCIAKLSSTGTGAADAIWNPSIDHSGFVYALATDTSGNVYAGGQFSAIGGLARSEIAKLNASGAGAVDATWDPSADGPVWALAADGSGNVYAGGLFSTIGGQTRANIAKLSSSAAGAADPLWNPSPDFDVLAIALDTGNHVYVGGGFSHIGGQNLSGLVRVQRDGVGTVDSTWSPSPNSAVFALAFDSSGNVYAAGNFFHIGGQDRLHIARLPLAGAGAADASWNASLSDIGFAVAIGDSGVVYAGGDFGGSGGQTRLGLVALSNSNGAAGAAVDAEAPGRVHAIASQPQGGTIVAGNFLRANGLARANILRLQQDLTLDPVWNPMADGEVDSLSIDGSGNIFAGGRFQSIGGLQHRGVAKLSGTGSGAVDALWNPDCLCNVMALATDTLGNVYVGGGFLVVGGQLRSNIARLSASGNVDSLWNPSPDGDVEAIALDGNGNVFVGGGFGQIGGQSRSHLAKLSSGGTGTADAGWNPSPNSSVRALALDASGDVFVGGAFSSIGGSSQSLLAKLSGTGSGNADTGWFTYGLGGWVDTISIAADGRVYMAGVFDTVNGANIRNLARLTSNGGADTSWNPSPDGEVFALTPDANNSMFVGGSFKNIGGRAVTSLVLLATDGIFSSGFESR